MKRNTKLENTKVQNSNLIDKKRIKGIWIMKVIEVSQAITENIVIVYLSSAGGMKVDLIQSLAQS